MDLWIVIVLISLAGLGAGLWVLRRRTEGHWVIASSDDGVPSSLAVVPVRRGQDAALSPPKKPMQFSRNIVDGVTNTSLPQLPENQPLAVLEFDGPPGRVPVQRGEIVIGRHSDDDVRIPDIRVSRHHARLLANQGGFEIENLTTARPDPNPMLVNGTSRNSASVADGDVITLGGVSFTLRLASG